MMAAHYTIQTGKTRSLIHTARTTPSHGTRVEGVGRERPPARGCQFVHRVATGAVRCAAALHAKSAPACGTVAGQPWRRRRREAGAEQRCCRHLDATKWGVGLAVFGRCLLQAASEGEDMRAY